MNFLNKFNIKSQIIFAFTIVIVITVLSNYIFYNQSKKLESNVVELGQNWLPSIEDIGKLNFEIIHLRSKTYRHYVTKDMDAKMKIGSEIVSSMDTIEALSKVYLKHITTDEEKQMWDLYKIQYTNFLNQQMRYVELSISGDDNATVAFLEGESKNTFDSLQVSISKIINANHVSSLNETDKAKTTFNASVKTIIIVSIMVLLFGIGIGLFISNMISKNIKNINDKTKDLVRNISSGNLKIRADKNNVGLDFVDVPDELNNLIEAFYQPMKLTAEYIQKISNGDIPEQIEINQEGDFRTLALNINQLINNLNLFVDEMKKMSKEHELGEIEVKVDISKFKGAYLTMASGVNEMVQSHIDVKKSAMAVFSEYGNGNFEANIASLPGKKIFINNTINVVQTNLKSISQTISDLAINAKNGNLSSRADTSKLSGDWALMVNEVNNLIDQLLNPINEAVSVLQDMSDGNFSTSMKGDYKGDHAILKHTINQTIDQMPFKEAVRVLQKLAKGDFTDKMQGDFKGDSLLLKNALNNTIESITEILTQVSSTVDEVTKGSMQVSDASSSLSQGATEQAASLEEITSTMSEIGSQTRTNASNASIASNLTYQAKEASETGNREMGDLNKSMSEISQSSRDISKIIKVIDEIAFQTNLLALNAAVEAARAGRHGKGFAVVAEEVRNLAARSATAAKETAEMIESSIRLVEKGANLANKTSNALEQIRDGAIKAADIVGDIAKSSNDQALAISQINEGLKQIDTVTQTNTASAEESASAAEVLSSQAENLKSMILKFNLNSTFAFDNQYASTSSTPKLMTGNNKNKSLPEKSENYKDLSFDELINLNNDDFGRY